MSAHTITKPELLLEELQDRLSRAHTLALEIQRVALDTQTGDAADGLNLIDALSDALGHRIVAMQEDASAAQRRFGEILRQCTVLSAALADDAEGAGHD